MRKPLIFMALMLGTFATRQVLAQEQNAESPKQTLTSKSSRMSLGFNLNQVQTDFGIGISATSPFFLHKNIAVRVSGSIQWLENIPMGSTESTWGEYNHFRIGIVGVGGTVANSIRLYGEGGFVFVLPNKEFSDKNVIGGYGLFGFEFFMWEKMNYFIELGSMGTGAVAEKSVGKPKYSNGFMISTGIRVNL